MVCAVNVPPWWNKAKMPTVFPSCTKHKEVVMDRACFSIGEVCVATWHIFGDSIAGMVFQVVLGMDSISLLSEAEYIAQKHQMSDAIQSKPSRDGAPRLMTTKRMDDAIIFSRAEDMSQWDMHRHTPCLLAFRNNTKGIPVGSVLAFWGSYTRC